METGWWIALGVVVLLALVAAYVDGTGRLRRRPRDGAAGRPPGGTAPPRPGELWRGAAGGPEGAALWLVLGTGADAVRAAPVTSAHVAGEAGRVTEGAVRAAGVRSVPLGELRERAGAVDAAVWDRVRHLAD
ncbi:type II toxin-antitoxin system PemK/MazF family toxin [Streptomyces sp. JJ36]|uniref:type II toxin-antitoxin system PemK/MazF family toxin n=1 Tax=Streptomyces sp. JJ36 TaxID=2736645 RepID=UPI001F1A2F21|nr:type II toxin-antitoxin system PemK/MazF family toxin [Streptomyces sp. JJ36]MCF6525603.1 type II toxin-antitoxin system PemK/MazF family toxin [Streptomyces sp. JJ36]